MSGSNAIMQDMISTHALREEGDLDDEQKVQDEHLFLPTPSARRATIFPSSARLFGGNFYPRPPRGGRHISPQWTYAYIDISTHALREEGDQGTNTAKHTEKISTHALREEGDPY